MTPPAEPPPFQEGSRCDVCSCSFNTFRRRHHCRCCGRTLCHEHSSNQMALPQFGIYSSVRVCSNCFNNSYRMEKDDLRASVHAVTAADAVTDKFSKLDVAINTDVNPDNTLKNTVVVPDCKCGMPLCICEAPQPDPVPVPVQKVAVTIQPHLRSKKNPIPQKESTSISTMPSSSNCKPSFFFHLGQASDGKINKSNTHYEPNGEGLREAIKNNDISAVKKLLTEGVDSNYCDKQGLTLLHLAALFNHTEIAFILMDCGARPDSKNAQGETPLDCAPTMLQHKMRQKIDEGA